MIKLSTKKTTSSGFSLVEILISLAIYALIFITMTSFLLATNNSNLKNKADAEAVDSARSALEEMTHEIRSAGSVYASTTTTNQLSLETTNYAPSGETDTYIDFFLCGTAVCLKKESLSPIALTSSSVQVTSLSFSQITTGVQPSVQVNLTVSYSAPGSVANSSISLTSTASLRSYQ